MDEKLLRMNEKIRSLEAAMEEVRIRGGEGGVEDLISDSEEGSKPHRIDLKKSLPTTGSEWFGLAGDNQ